MLSGRSLRDGRRQAAYSHTSEQRGPAGDDCVRAAGTQALDSKILIAYPAADASIERIGDLSNHDLQAFTPRAAEDTRASLRHPTKHEPT